MIEHSLSMRLNLRAPAPSTRITTNIFLVNHKIPIISPISAKTTVLYPWDPTDKSTVYANGDAGHVLRSIDNGKTWTVLVDYQGLD